MPQTLEALDTPAIGDGATICWHSDRHAATVIAVSPSGKTVTVQEDRSIRIDHNGMSESQEYRYEPDADGATYQVRCNARGQWRVLGGGQRVLFGERRAFRDFSF